uniref:Uncharacterized protein n=1 Tax=Tetraselmis sp. GSL018 TaxID=582737 RepID=A0A061RWE2_9CHLO
MEDLEYVGELARKSREFSRALGKYYSLCLFLACIVKVSLQQNAPGGFARKEQLPKRKQILEENSWSSRLLLESSNLGLTVLDGNEFASALRDNSVSEIIIADNIEIDRSSFGEKAISLHRDLLIRGANCIHSGCSGTLYNIGFLLPPNASWLRLENSSLVIMGVKFDSGLFEVGHDQGHMPITMLGVDFFGSRTPYCRCTSLAWTA